MEASKFNESTGVILIIKRSLILLVKLDRLRLYLFIFLQLFVSVLDTIGILLMGAIASIGISIISNSASNASLVRALGHIGFENASQKTAIVFLGSAAVSLLLLRTFLSLVISFKTYRFLARKAGEVSAELMKGVFAFDFSWLRKQSSQDVAYALTEGVQYAIVGILSSFITLGAEVGLLLITFSVLMFVNIVMAIVALGFFSTFGALVHFQVGTRITKISKRRTAAAILGFGQIRDVLDLFREITVMSRMDFFVARFRSSRLESSRLFADQTWIQQIPRVSVEVAIVLGGAFLAITSTLTSSFTNAITDLVVFLAAASRLAPSALRLQQAALSVKSFAGSAGSAFEYTQFRDMFSENLANRDKVNQVVNLDRNHLSHANIELIDVNFTFDDAELPTLIELNLTIPALEVIALVGPSGAGKSTFCDLLLGLHSPTTGSVVIGGLPAKDYVKANPGRIAYLPQEVQILADTVLANVAVGIPPDEIDSERLWYALQSSQLAAFVRNQPLGVMQLIGESGIQLSGGQRQRVGLARALYSDPAILILDEPTSALDAETEDMLMQTLRSLKSKCSILIIAHRLSTVRFVDRVLYLEDGRILGDGTFLQLREAIPRFDLQAGLQGL